MASIRESIAAEASVGGIKFWATAAQGDGPPRRIVSYTGVGVEGAYTEDLGRDARRETLNAIVSEDIYIKLKNLRDDAKVVTAIHPLFGVFQARVENVTYRAGPDDLVDITVELLEHGDPAIFLAPQTVTLGGSTQNAKSIFDDAATDLDGLDAIPDQPDNLSNASGAFSDGLGDFDTLMDSALEGDALFDDMAAGFDDLAKLGGDLIDAVDSAYSDLEDLVMSDITDTVYDCINAARDVVDSLENQISDVWQTFKVIEPISIAELALELMGDDSDETVQLILDRNQTIIDVNAVPIGLSVSVPVLQ